MREAAFVRQNKDKWIAFEKALQQKNQVNPDELADYYIQLTNDLAFAQTYYADSKTLMYLNGLTSEVHQLIYRNKKESKNKILDFWITEFPLFFYRHQKTLFFSFLIFTVSTFIGVLSALGDDSFIRLILGDSYVNQTIHNIESGDPAAIYQSGGAVGSFLGITINNIRVAFFAYALGVFTSLGTGYILFSNGVMLGAFMTMFYEHNVLWTASKSVWLHGTIEISVIVVAGCAGMVMGNSLLFPKTFSRTVSFLKGAKDGLKIVVSTIPFFIIAGFIEGFFTRYSRMPSWIAFTVIGLSFILVVFYYVIYPIILNRIYEEEVH